MDWVLWIDTDERLMDPERVPKYLRANIFNGYSIRQHHFACDTAFKPDLPVRLFRRGPQGGKTMRFFGMIHEHPELGLNEGPGLTVVLSKKAGEEGVLYGSVTPTEIADALSQRGIQVDRRRIELAEPIKRLGEHRVHIRLQRDVTAELTVDVQPVAVVTA